MRYIFCLIISLWLCNDATAGVMPSRSRIVYTEKMREQSLMLVNTNAYPVIVQTWVDNGQGTPDVSNIPFVSVPSVFRLEPQSIKGIRILYNGSPVPRNRESLYWFNIYEIPPDKKDSAVENSVLVTMNTQIKLFYRPAGINVTPEEAMPKITCTRNDKRSLLCHNPSPIHLSVIALKARHGGITLNSQDADLLISPFSDKIYHLNKVLPDKFSVEFSYINDAGEQHTWNSSR